MKIKIDSIGFAQGSKYRWGLAYLKTGLVLTASGLLLTAVGLYGTTHASTWMVSSTDEQRKGIVSIFKDYDNLCDG